jgi:hypothetical protein
MNENYYALYLAIIKNYTPEQAFKALETGKTTKVRLNKELIDVMINLRNQGMTLKEIGEMFGGISASAVCHKITYHKKRKNRLNKEI